MIINKRQKIILKLLIKDFDMFVENEDLYGLLHEIGRISVQYGMDRKREHNNMLGKILDNIHQELREQNR